jgi:hypothetical protein
MTSTLIQRSAASPSTPGRVRQTVYNVRDYGARGDHRAVTDGVCTAGSAIVTSATAAFTAADVGKLVWVAPTDRSTAPRTAADGAIASGTNTLTSTVAAWTAADVGAWVSVAGAGLAAGFLVAQIAGVSGTTATLAANAQTTVASAGAIVVFSLGTSSGVAQRAVSDGAITTGTAALTSATAGFTAADVGRYVTVTGAGSAGGLLTSQIVAVSGTTATLTLPANTSTSGATITLRGVRAVSDAAITVNTVTLTSATAAFVATDAGGLVTIAGAGLSGADLVAQIVTVTNSTTVALTTPAGTSVSGAGLTIAPAGALAGTIVSYQSATQVTLSQAASIACVRATVGLATDDTAAIQAAFAAAAASGGGEVIIPPGTYCISRAGNNTVYSAGQYCLNLLASNVAVRGYGATLMVAGGNQRNISGILVGDGVNPYQHISIAGLILDGNAKAGVSPPGNIGAALTCIPSQIGCAPIWGASDFVAGINVRGPYTAGVDYPKAGQQFTRYVAIRDCTFLRWAQAGLITISYTQNVHLEGCLFDGQAMWGCICHLDGLQDSYVAGNWFRDNIPESPDPILSFPMNGDTGFRPCKNTTVVGNVIVNTQIASPTNPVGGGVTGINGCFHNCTVVGNTVEGMVGYGIILTNYNLPGNNIYSGSHHTVVTGNRLINCRFGLLIAGTAGTMRSVSDGVMGSGSATLSSATAAFVTGDVGAWVSVAGAQPGGKPLVTAIVSRSSGTQVLLAGTNTSGGAISGKALTIGGQDGQNSRFNVITGNQIYNDATTKYGSDYSGLGYVTRTWTTAGEGIDVGGAGTMVPIGGNLIASNHIEGTGTAIIRDPSIGCGGGVTTVYNQYSNNDVSTENVGATRISVASPYVRMVNLTNAGLAIGQQGNSASNVLGTGIAEHQSVTAAWTPGALNAAAAATLAVTVTGAAIGDSVYASYDQALTAGLLLSAQVTSANTVTVTIFNATAGSLTPAAGTVRVDWWGH